MNDDDRQTAAAKCLSAGYLLDPVQPYSGRQFRAALRTAIIDRCRHEKSDRRRNEGRERLGPTERYAPSCDDPEHNVQWRDEKRRLHAAVAKLPRRQRRVIRACDLRGTTVREYAAKLNETESTIRSLRNRALGTLREQLAGREKP